MTEEVPKIHNHYVPKFYLKHFSVNKIIGIYNFDKQEFSEESIRKTACRDYLYGKDTSLEDWFMRLEGRWARVIHNILLHEKYPIDSTEYTYLLMFVYLGDVRTAKRADDFKASKLEEGKCLARMMAAEGKIALSDEEIENLDVEIDRPNLSYIEGLKDLIPILSDLCPLIIVNESKVGFVTSDVPVAKYNQYFIENGYRHPYGYGHVGFQCFVPLSPRVCFCLYDDTVYKNKLSNKSRVRLYREADIEELNRLFIQNAYKEVYFDTRRRKWLEKNIGVKTVQPRDEWTMGSSQAGFLQKVSECSVYDVIKIPIFKTNPAFKTAFFPYDEAGPIRKSAFEKINQWI
jgi:hypothetical protein